MTHFFKKLFKGTSKDKLITIVSGLPRSGTSMMMQMLEAGGIEGMTDNIRKANKDNLKGYYEFERVKKIAEDKSWLDDCQGKAVKIISMLLYHLPPGRRYKVIFIQRKMEEVLASQKVMLKRRGEKEDSISDEKMAEKFEKHLHQIEDWITNQDDIDVLYIKYNEIIEDPHLNAKAVNQFLGGWLDEEKMAKVVEDSLYRQRKN